jgi:hypothetical protein
MKHPPPVYLDGVGWLPADWMIAGLTLAAGVAQVWQTVGAWPERRTEAWIRGAMAAGWMLWSARFWLALAVGLDPVVAPPGIVAITLISAGTISIAIMRGGR